MKIRLAAILILVAVSGADAGLMGIVINEIVPDPSGPLNNIDTDGDGLIEATDEYIELANSTTAAVDMSGWQLYVEVGGTQVLRHTFSAGTSIAGRGFLALVTDWDPGSPPSNIVEIGAGSSMLANSGDSIALLDTNTNTYGSWVYNGATSVTTGLPGGATQTSLVDLGVDADGFGISAIPDFQESTFRNDVQPTPGFANVPEPSSVLFLLPALAFGGWLRWRRP